MARTAVLRKARGGFGYWDRLSTEEKVTYAELGPTTMGGIQRNYDHYNPEALNLHRMGAPTGLYPMGPIRAEHLNTQQFKEAHRQHIPAHLMVSQHHNLEALMEAMDVLPDPRDRPIRVLWGESDGAELPVFSLHALNEFLSEPDGSRTYGDYLDEHWDRIYALFMAGGLVEYPHTKALSRDHFLKQSHSRREGFRLFIFEDWMPPALRREMEAATRDQVTAVVVDGDMNLTALKGHYRDYLHWCLGQIGAAPLATHQELRTECWTVFRDVLRGTAKGDRLGAAANRRMVKDLEKVVNYATSTPSEVKRSTRPTDEVLELVRAFGAIPDTTAKDASYFIHALAYSEHFSMGMSPQQRNTFLDTVLAREDALSVIRFLGDVMMDVDGELPSTTAWNRLLAEDTDFTMSPALVIPLAGADLNNRAYPRYIQTRLKEYRRDMRAA